MRCPARVVIQMNLMQGYGESLVYDSLARPKTRTIVSDQTYQFDYTYNAVLGQLETLTYPTSTAGVRFKAKLGYLAGYLASVQDYTGNVNGSVLWNLNLLDARMNATSETYGNGLWLQNGYDALTGVPTTRKSGTGGQQSNVQNLAYGWDLAGNLTSRQDLLQSISETFQYDALDRLTVASGPGVQSTTIAYDAIGNISSKTGVGSYTYHATKKHAVANAGGTSYLYDGNGNLISRGGATVGWSSYNYPTNIGDPNGYSAQFWYAPDRSRWKQVSTYSGATETTIYVGGLLEKFTNAVTTHWKHSVPTPSGEVQVIRRANGTSETLYVTTDPLGSTDAVLNAAGTVVMRVSFAAYGERRASNWQGAPSGTEWQAIADTTRRGYTGHEALDNVMLVHMNGRVFDPRIGRFTSADPLIDGSASTQGWNRYGYVHGRVMSATDPSGFSTSNDGPIKCISCIPIVSAGGYWSQSGSAGTDSGSGLFTVVTWPVWVPVDWGMISGGPTGTVTSGGGGGDNTGKTGESKTQGEEPIKNWLCEAGNSVADGADGLGNVSGQLLLAGLGIAGVGFVTAQPEITGPGLALAATGGLGNIGAGVLQLGAGLLQGAGGGGFSNSGYAALSLATGLTLARGITGPAIGGYRTVSQRAGDAFRNGTATVAGGVNDAWTSLIDAAAPRQVSCPGGN